MSETKNAMIILIIAGVIFVVSSAWCFGGFILDFIEYPGFYDIFDFTYPVLWLLASLLLMIGFILLREGGGPTRATTVRLCGKCGRSISANARFCPYCGWKPTTETD